MVRAYAPNTQKLAWSPDGKLLAYLQGLEPKFNAYMQDHLAVVPAAGGVPRPLTDKLDRAVMSFAFAADSGSIMIAVEDDGRIYPARVDLPGGAITREVAAGSFVVSALSSAAGHTAPSFVSGRKYPTVLWIHGGPNGQDEHSLVLDGYQCPHCSWGETRTSMFRSSAVSRCIRRCALWECRHS
jgi:hypothetical protein